MSRVSERMVINMSDEKNASFVDINPIYSGEITSTDFSYRFFPEKIRPDIHFEEKAYSYGRIYEKTGGPTKTESYIELSISINAHYKTQCARCTSDLEESFALSTAICVVSELADDENDDYILAKDGIVDIASLSEMLISLNLPFRSLCSSDCKGLCVTCGKNLNEGKCSCSKEKGDPRFAILKKLLDKDEN